MIKNRKPQRHKEQKEFYCFKFFVSFVSLWFSSPAKKRKPQRHRGHKEIFMNGKKLIVMGFCFIFSFFLVQPSLYGQEDQVKMARAYVQQAVSAYKEKNYASYLENLKKAHSLRPDHPTIS